MVGLGPNAGVFPARVVMSVPCGCDLAYEPHVIVPSAASYTGSQNLSGDGRYMYLISSSFGGDPVDDIVRYDLLTSSATILIPFTTGLPGVTARDVVEDGAGNWVATTRPSNDSGTGNWRIRLYYNGTQIFEEQCTTVGYDARAVFNRWTGRIWLLGSDWVHTAFNIGGVLYGGDPTPAPILELDTDGTVLNSYTYKSTDDALETPIPLAVTSHPNGGIYWWRAVSSGTSKIWHAGPAGVGSTFYPGGSPQGYYVEPDGTLSWGDYRWRMNGTDELEAIGPSCPEIYNPGQWHYAPEFRHPLEDFELQAVRRATVAGEYPYGKALSEAQNPCPA